MSKIRAERPEFLQTIHDLAADEPDIILAKRGLALIYEGKVIQDKDMLLNLAAALKKGLIAIESEELGQQIDRFLIINAVSLFKDQVPDLIKWIEYLKFKTQEEQEGQEGNTLLT